MIVKEFLIGDHRCTGYAQACQYATEIAKREGSATIVIKLVEMKDEKK